MKTLRMITMLICLTVAAAAHAQTTPVPGQQVPTTVPQPTTAPENAEGDKKPEFNAPQTPVRPAQVPSEDTLIKGRRSSGAVIEDRMMPSTDKKSERAMRRKNKKGTMESDDANAAKAEADTVRKP